MADFFATTVGTQHLVMRQGAPEADFDDIICVMNVDAPEGSAEEIARSLNRLPQAEALLIEIAQAIRSGADAQPLADKIEEWVVG